MLASGRILLKTPINVAKRQMSLKSMAYKLSRFGRYGLMRDDLRNDAIDADVEEALRRCPRCKVDERNYRILRANQLAICRQILPKSEWMTLECDELYLTPLVNEVIREKNERLLWDKTH